MKIDQKTKHSNTERHKLTRANFYSKLGTVLNYNQFSRLFQLCMEWMLNKKLFNLNSFQFEELLSLFRNCLDMTSRFGYFSTFSHLSHKSSFSLFSSPDFWPVSINKVFLYVAPIYSSPADSSFGAPCATLLTCYLPTKCSLASYSASLFELESSVSQCPHL